MKGGSFMANTEIFLRNIFGTTRPNIRPLVLALNITNDLLFEQHISMSDIKARRMGRLPPQCTIIMWRSVAKYIKIPSLRPVALMSFIVQSPSARMTLTTIPLPI